MSLPGLGLSESFSERLKTRRLDPDQGLLEPSQQQQQTRAILFTIALLPSGRRASQGARFAAKLAGCAAFRPLSLLLGAALAATPAFAQRLPRTVVPDHYDLAFDGRPRGARFEGVETIRVRIGKPTPRIVLNALDLDVPGRDDRPPAVGDPESHRLARSTAADGDADRAARAPQGPAEIHIRYTGVLNDKLRGFYLSKTSERKLRRHAVRIDRRAPRVSLLRRAGVQGHVRVTLTIDRGDTAISNGRLLSDTPGPGARQHTIKFSTTPKMSSYLVAMAVGDFKCLDGAADGIPIRICATPDKKDLGRIALESAQQILKFYNSYYAIKYPFGKLDVVAVPDFAAGAMENTAAIFYRETDLLADSATRVGRHAQEHRVGRSRTRWRTSGSAIW